jgi:sigma-B regulation protein RsbQ
MDLRHKHHLVETGAGTRPMVFSHGFGCDQQMWRHVAPAFEPSHRVICFDHVGCGRSDASAYDEQRHATLLGYARDVVELLEGLDLTDVVFVGHSVSAMIGLLASLMAPQRFAALVLIGPSPRYLNDDQGYVGGFAAEDIQGLLELMDSNMMGWAQYLAPVVIGPGHAPDFAQELGASFCAGDPYITRRFARATFLGDNRADLPKVQTPCLIVQTTDDAIAPNAVAEYVHQHLAGSELAMIDGSGHCPHMTHPNEVIRLIHNYLGAARST